MWCDHAFSQSNKTTKRAGDGGKILKNGVSNYRRPLKLIKWGVGTLCQRMVRSNLLQVPFSILSIISALFTVLHNNYITSYKTIMFSITLLFSICTTLWDFLLEWNIPAIWKFFINLMCYHFNPF